MQLPVPKVDEGTEVTEEILLASLKQVLGQHTALQAHNGHWPGDFSGLMFIMPIMVCYYDTKYYFAFIFMDTFFYENCTSDLICMRHVQFYWVKPYIKTLALNNVKRLPYK